MAAAAVYLLARAEAARSLRLETRDSAQVEMYLDAFEAYAMGVLEADLAQGATDHSAEIWARPLHDVPLDRGRAAGQIVDLQGRFNVNWLADTGNVAAEAAFRRLAARLGLSPQLAQRITAFVRPGGPQDRAGFAALVPPIDPVGGPVLMLEQLLVLPGVNAQILARISPFVSALPADSQLNVNTAPPEVVAAFTPGANLALLDRILSARLRAPFKSVEEFERQMAPVLAPREEDENPDNADSGFGAVALTVTSTWFGLTMSATLEGREMHRRAVIERLALPEGARVAYRLRDWRGQGDGS